MRTIPRNVWLFALILAIITALPYLIGALNTPQGEWYTGAPLFPRSISVDYNSHLAKMLQGERGQNEYSLLFTTEPHKALPIVQGFYLLMGKLATPILRGAALYHFARTILTFLMVISLWRLGARYFESQSHRWIFLFFSTLLTGIGWVLFILAPTQAADLAPIEFWLIDAYNLAGALFMPHFAAAVIFQASAIVAFERWLAETKPSSFITLTFCLAALSIIQPYSILLTAPLLALVSLYRVLKKQTSLAHALLLIIPGSIHAALIFYQYMVLNILPVWSEFTAQNNTLSPPALYYLLGYILFFAPILYAAIKRQYPLSKWILPLLWVLIVVALLYAPISTQRRYLLGVQTPLALLATVGWIHLTANWKQARRRLTTLAYIGVGAIPLVIMLALNIASVLQQPREGYYSQDERVAYAWMGRSIPQDSNILTVFDWSGTGSGGRLVAAAGYHVYLGHWIETVNFDQKIENVRRFHDPSTTDNWRCDFLRAENLNYVWYDDYAQAVGTWNPINAPYLSRVYGSDTVNIFEVTLNQCPTNEGSSN